jgi:L-rhamnose isomerase
LILGAVFLIVLAMPDADRIEQSYALARERYAEQGVDADEAVERLSRIPISLQCWQGDDLGGFERQGAALGGGLAVTGNYPGKARTPDELRSDVEMALSCIPGRHRFNLHAIYGEFGGKRVERDEVAPEHFRAWIDWARGRGLGLDFNPTFFSHPLADSGFTLSHRDEAVRRFWVRHGLACRAISQAMGQALGTPCVHNVWIPDGHKDLPADRRGPRERLTQSLDAVFQEPMDRRHVLDAVEGKLFGIGSECYTVGSHEYYLGYAVTRRLLLCLDSGHYHPTESVADKLSAVLQHLDGVLLHVSRGVRWDSDHVVILSDETRGIAEELVRGGYLDRVRIGLDFFDASINRVAAWVIGTRAMIKALLLALLEPIARLRELERAGDFTGRLAMLEETKTLPSGAVWDYYCLEQQVPVGPAWLEAVRKYERELLSRR